MKYMANNKKKKINIKGLLVILLALYLIIMVFYYAITLPVNNIIIKGNNLVNDSKILEAANISNNDKLILLNKQRVIKNIKSSNELIDDVKIKKSLNGTITISVVESKVLFLNILNNTFVLANGKEMNIENNILGIPVLINYTPSDLYANLIKKMANIDNDIIALISEIEYSPDIKNELTIDANRFLLRMNDGNFVYIDLANFNNLNRYKTIYATLDDEKGILNLDSSSDQVIFTTFKSLESRQKENELSK